MPERRHDARRFRLRDILEYSRFRTAPPLRDGMLTVLLSAWALLGVLLGASAQTLPRTDIASLDLTALPTCGVSCWRRMEVGVRSLQLTDGGA